ncbi:LPS translocon maturation chaperone LptM [Maricaulis sp.]|uniref:LPS translocon maturation chaperone LptM n=1 Tax=Maricaulis sp. TaxID=1486257 RepID=UPI003A9390DC|tara:strand:+ start:1990 stop:2151 length:162 start_codon:yes stop_codon:yes gene_type:complete
MMKRLYSLILILLGTTSLAACGLRGDLERPDPMWGHPQDAEAAADAADDSAGR